MQNFFIKNVGKKQRILLKWTNLNGMIIKNILILLNRSILNMNYENYIPNDELINLSTRMFIENIFLKNIKKKQDILFKLLRKNKTILKETDEYYSNNY